MKILGEVKAENFGAQRPKGVNKEVQTEFKNKQKQLAEKLYKAVEKATDEREKVSAYLHQYHPDVAKGWLDLIIRNSGKDYNQATRLKKLADQLISVSDPSKVQKQVQDQKAKRLKYLRGGIQIWTKGLNDRERHLLFEGRTP